MTLEEMMKFKGKATELEDYQKLLKKRDRLSTTIRNLSNKIQDEEDSISVFDGELSETQQKQFLKHVSTRKELIGQRAVKQGQFELTMKKIFELQGR
jgi:hypothetical protein